MGSNHRVLYVEENHDKDGYTIAWSRLNLQGCKLRARNYCMFEKSIDIGPKNSTIDIFDGDDSFR